MSEIGNKLLFDGDKFMPEMHLVQPAFGPSTKIKERIQNLKK